MQGFGLITDEIDPATTRIALQGELDLAHAFTFDEELRRVEAARPSCIVLDLRGLASLDSCGLARLLAARRRALRDGRRLLVVRGPAPIQRIFAVTALADVFEMVSEPPVPAAR
jgi:anti-sigma B factor antagonist